MVRLKKIKGLSKIHLISRDIIFCYNHHGDGRIRGQLPCNSHRKDIHNHHDGFLVCSIRLHCEHHRQHLNRIFIKK